MNWSDLSMSQRSELMSIYLKNGITSLDEMKKHYNSFAEGGSIDDPPYTKFLNTLPDNLKNSGDEYNMRRYWELNGYPKDFNEGIQKGMFTKQDDGYHANSVAFNPITNSYEFMKVRDHPTYNMELEWYYSDDPAAVEFRKNYKYTPGIGMVPDQYTPRRFDNGGPVDPRRFFGIATPEVTDNRLYKSSFGTMLPEVRVKDKRPSWQHNLTDYDLARLRSGQISPETAKSIAQKRATGTSGYMKDVNKLSWIPNGAMVLAGGLSGALANPYLWGALGLGSAAQNIEDKNYGEAALDVGLTFLGPELQLLNKGVEATRVGKSARIASELNKAVKNTRLQPKNIKNPVHNRFKLGDVEINDPNLMYHVDNGDYTGFSGNGAYVKDGMLFPSQHSNGQKPYTWWNLGNPYRNGQTRLLTTTKDNPSLLRVRDQNYPIGQWTGNPKDRTFVTNQEYVSSEPIRIENQYVWEPGYGYRKYSNDYNTLPLKDVLDTKISLTHAYPREYLKSLVASKHKSLIIPSTADTPIAWRDDPILFLDNSTLKKYPHQSYLGDGETNTVNGVWGRDKDLTKYSVEELQNHIDNNIGLVKASYLPEKAHPATDNEVLFNSRLRRYTDLNNPEMYKGVDTYDEVHFHSPVPVKNAKYAFVPNREDLPYFDELGIKTNFDFSGDEGYDLQKFRDWILNNDNGVAFKGGGKIFIKPENRGKFTALKKRTGHSATWFKENGTPTQKKMAVFELNSKKWRK